MSPRFSVVVPTLNEETRLVASLEAAQAAFGQDAEYVVSDGGSTDATIEIAQRLAARVIRGQASRGGQLDRGFRAARGEICVFLHADTLIPANAARAIENAIASGAIGGAFSLTFTDAKLGHLEHAINWRSRTFGSATGDQVIFARSSILKEIGGVPPVPLFEDVRLCRELKRVGKFVILSEKVSTSARLWKHVGTKKGIMLHWAFRLMHALGVSPHRLARWYPSPRS